MKSRSGGARGVRADDTAGVAFSGESEPVPTAYAPPVAPVVSREDEGDDLVWDAPRWVLLVGTVAVLALVAACFLVFWRDMGTAPRESAVEAFGVAFGLLVLVSGIGAFREAARRRGRPPGSGNR